jgi:hypothetical protein
MCSRQFIRESDLHDSASETNKFLHYLVAEIPTDNNINPRV